MRDLALFILISGAGVAVWLTVSWSEPTWWDAAATLAGITLIGLGAIPGAMYLDRRTDANPVHRRGGR